MPTNTSLTFENEQLLRQALVGLLVRIDGITGVQLNHDRLEQGKDILFTLRLPIGQPLNCAAVVKNTPFSGRVGPGGLKATIHQIEQCFDTPFLDTRIESRSVHCVYLINPHDITPTAKAAIEGAIKSRRVEFVTGAELYRWFELYWPEYLADEASFLARFSQDLEVAAGSRRALKELAKSHNLDSVFEVIPSDYLRPSFEREILTRSLPPQGFELVQRDALEGRWKRSIVGSLRAHWQRVREFLAHVDQWELQQRASSLPSLVDVDLMHLRLFHALDEAIQRRLPQQTQEDTFKKVDESTTLSSDDILALVPLQETTASAMTAWEGAIRRLLAELTECLAAINDDSDDTILDQPSFQRACRIDEVFRAAPQNVLGDERARVFRFTDELHHRVETSLVIAGGPGSGKTTFCTRNALLDARLAVEGPSHGRKPAYVALHRIAVPHGGTFTSVLLEQAKRSALLPQVGVRDSSSAERYYLDGYDEVTAPETREALLRLIQKGTEESKLRQVVITTRDYVRDEWLLSYPRVSLSGLSDEGIRELSGAWLGNDDESVTKLMEELEDLPSILNLIRVPLLTIVTALVYKRTRHIPTDRAALYDTFADLLCGGWDVAKSVVRESRYGIDIKHFVLQALAAQAHGQRERQFGTDEIRAAAAHVLPKKESRTYDKLITELVADGIITQIGTSYHFRHLSFQEFFAAKHLADPLGNGDPKAVLLQYVNGDDWWLEVLRFYVLLLGSLDDARAFLNRAPADAYDRLTLVREVLYDAYRKPYDAD